MSRPSQPLEAALALQEPFLQRLARALVQDENTAADLVQDTVAAALTHVRSDGGRGRRARLESLPPEGLRGWLSTVLRNTRTDRVRASRRLATVGPEALGSIPGGADSPEGIALRLERQQLLHGALMSLPEVQRTVLVLRYQDGRSIAEIAGACGSPVPTIKSRLHRGLGLLKEELQRRSGGDEGADPRWLAAMVALAQPPAVSIPPNPAGAPIIPAIPLAMWKPLAAVLFSVLLVMGIVFAIASRTQRSPVENGVEVAAAPTREAAVIRAPGQGGGARSALAQGEGVVSGNGSALPSVLTGTAVSAMSGQPVPALVSLVGGTETRASIVSGDFLLRRSPEAEPRLVFEHPLFEPLEMSLSAWEGKEQDPERGVQPLGLVELVPRGRAQIQVLDGLGNPVAGARCTLHRSLTQTLDGRGPGPNRLDRPRPVGSTDAAGLLDVPLAFTASVSVVGPGGRMGVALASAGEQAVVHLDGPARTITFLDHASGEPVAGRAFPMGWQRGAAQVGLFVRTDAQGKAALPVGAGRLLICKSEPRLLLESMTIGDRSVEGLRPGAFKTSDLLAADESEVTVGVSNHEFVLQLVDAESGEPVDGEAYCQLRHLRPNGEWSGPGADTLYPVVDGAMTVHSWFVEPQEGVPSSDTQRWIAVPGYATHTIPGDVDLVDATIRLQRGSQRRLQMLDSLGNPKPVRLFLELGPGQVICPEIGVDGKTPPLPWSSCQGWRINAPGFDAGDGWHVISPDRLEAEEVVVLQDSTAGGTIRITGVPEGSPPVFAAEQGLVPAPGLAAEPGALEIRGLAPGDYTVGPQAWVLQLINRTRVSGGHGENSLDPKMLGLLVHVDPGETQVIPWDGRWGGSERLAGRVQCAGSEGTELAALPIYGRTDTTIYFETNSAWLYCDANGDFETRPGDPVPEAFLFATFEQGAFGRKPVILDSQRVRPDGRYSITPTSYTLVATNAEDWKDKSITPRQRPTVWNQSSPQYLDAPMTFLHGSGPSGWNPAEVLDVQGLPCHVHELRLSFRGETPDLVIPITPGGHQRIEVQVPIPEPAARSGGAGLLFESR